MKLTRLILILSMMTLLGLGCGSSKPVKIISKPKPSKAISYKLISTFSFEHLDVSYLTANNAGKRQKNIKQNPLEIPIGFVHSGFIASISSTGYGANDSLAKIELQIFENGVLVASRQISGANPSLAISYIVD